MLLEKLMYPRDKNKYVISKLINLLTKNLVVLSGLVVVCLHWIQSLQFQTQLRMIHF
jgi:hypothetical protein